MRFLLNLYDDRGKIKLKEVKMKMITIKDDLELKAYIDSLNDDQLSLLLDMVRDVLHNRLQKIQKSGNYNIDRNCTFSVDQQLQAKALVDVLDDNSLTFMVLHMLRVHSDTFLPMITFKEVKI